MKMAELKEDILIIEWLSNINAAVNTEKSYLAGMQAYTEFTKLNPNQLLDEAENEASSGTPMRRREIKKRLITFRKNLFDKGLADFTVRTRVAGVQSFYNAFEIELPKLLGERRRARGKEGNKAVPQKEDLQDVLRVCDPLEKSIVLLGASSGLASSEVRNIKLKQFLQGYDPKTGITTFKITREKTGTEFFTFCSPETSEAIWNYIKLFRNRDAKSATHRRREQLDKQRTYSEDGFLFISRLVSDEFLETHNEELRKLTGNAIQKLYRAISEKAKKNSKAGCFNMIRSHTARKYFNSALLNAGADSFFVEFVMGHTIDDTRGAYFRAAPEKLKEIYKRFIPYLTIQTNLDVLRSSEYQELINERDKYKGIAAEYVTTGLELINAQHEIKKLKAQKLTPEEKKKELIEWATNYIPENEAEAERFKEIKKSLGVV